MNGAAAAAAHLANAGRPDLDRLVQARHIPAGEPIFLLRARDPVARQAILGWIASAHDHGVSPAVIEEAFQQLDAFEAWATKQLPNADHLSEAERKQLEYELGRRAWRQDFGKVPDPAVIHAYQRGWDAAMALVRAEQHGGGLL